MRILVALAVLLAPVTAQACNYYPSATYYYPSATYYTPYVEQKVEVKKFTVFEFVQPYFVGAGAPYVAPPTAPVTPPASTTSTPCDAKIADLRAELAEMRKMLQPAPQVAPRRPSRPVEEEPAPPPRQTSRSVFATKCAGCHDSSVAAQKGGKLALFEFGQPVGLPADVAEKCVEEMRAGHMPKKAKLTAREFMSVTCEIESLVAKE